MGGERGRAASESPRIVIVGGGAGGLELATRLGDRLGRRGRASITLIDKCRAHLWKPLLHEVAAGSMDLGQHELNYLAQSYWHHFRFLLGEMADLDRAGREIKIAPFIDEDGTEVTPERRLGYDKLIFAVGGVTNDFGTPGVEEFAVKLDTSGEAARFHRRLVNACIRAQAQPEALRPGQLQVAIIGAGATGIELAAELHKTTRELIAYGFDRINPEKDIRLTIIEAAGRVLPALPLRIAQETLRLLGKLGIEVHTSARVAEVMAGGVRLGDGRTIPAELVVWAAGVRAPRFLKEIGGLETNRLDQLLVRSTLQATRDDDVFAIGDCAACPWLGTESIVPPRAQAAHQQASHLLRELLRQLSGQPMRPFRYRDFGSLVSLGEYSTVGNLMGALIGGSIVVEGLFARLMYLSLYKLHQYALHGFAKVFLDTLARLITRRTEPQVKLH